MYKLILTFILITCSLLGKCNNYLLNNSFTGDTTYSCFEHVQQIAKPFDTIFIEASGKIYKSLIINKPLHIIGISLQPDKNLKSRVIVEAVFFGMGSLGSTVQNLSIKNEIHICESQILIRNCKINSIYINPTSKPLNDIIIADNIINSISNGQISISEIFSRQSFPVTNLTIKNNRIVSKSIYSIYFSKQIQGEIYNNTIIGKIFSNGTKKLENTLEENKKNLILTLL
jgi:hypothetical protein